MKYKGSSHVDRRSGIRLSSCSMNCMHNMDKIPLYTVYMIQPISTRLTKDEAQKLLLNYIGQEPYTLELRQKGFKLKGITVSQ